MTIPYYKTYRWIDPLIISRNLARDYLYWGILYSGQRTPVSGRYSYIFFDPVTIINAQNFTPMESLFTTSCPPLENAWFGYFGYDLKNSLEQLPIDTTSYITLPDLWFGQFNTILQCDHDHHCIHAYSHTPSSAIHRYLKDNPSPLSSTPDTLYLSSNMTKDEYFEKILAIQDAILRGDLYQANLTRKFFGRFTQPPACPFDIFCRLSHYSPSAYSAYFKIHKNHILSSSPERFLHIDAKGLITAQPIKGSAPRFAEAAQDQISRLSLLNSIKDRAENLMIVDLIRNDLSKHCHQGTVKTEKLCALESYPTIHHLVSTVTGQKSHTASTLDVIKGCFPPGSMTGTPKIKAMELCSALEKLRRGCYAGALGWLGGDGSADLSVVIRTLFLEEDRFEFQVGGAIVTDSLLENELQETLTKATAIARTLQIPVENLAKL